MLHRDLKPANIQLGDFGEVVVLDWGLAGTVRDAEPPTDESCLRATLPGHVFGTPEYMSPEQASGDIARIDQRSDIYGLGAILYQLLTGSPPFCGASLSETLALVRECEPVPVRELYPEVPAGLEAICHKALSKQPEDRFAEATGLAAAVLQWQESERQAAEEALRASEEKYRTLIEAIPQVAWIARRDGGLEYVNHKARSGTGEVQFRERFLGLGWMDFIHPEDLPSLICAQKQAHDTGSVYECEYRERHPDGTSRWKLARAVPVRDPGGRIEKWFGTTTDVHDLKEASRQRDEALKMVRANEERYRLLTEMIPHSVWTATPEGIPDYMNRHALDLVGLGLEDIGRDGWQQAVHPDDLPGFLARWQHSLATGELFETECRIRNSAGEYRWYFSQAVAIRDDQGRITQWFGTNTGIETIMRAEK